jgi:hypothetical protein
LETATAFHPLSAGIVTVENGVIVDVNLSVDQAAKQSVPPYHLRYMEFIRGYSECQVISIVVFPEIQNDLE